MGKIDVGTLVSASFAFIRSAWEVAPAALVVAVIVGAAAQGWAQTYPGLSFWPLVQAGAVTLATGALYRSVLGADHPADDGYRLGPGGIQWGGVEWRVLGANLVVGVLIGLVAGAIFIVWGIGFGILIGAHQLDPSAFQNLQSQGYAGLARLMSGPAGLVSAVVLIPGAALLLYLSARFSLYAVQAADTRGFDLGRAWSMTRGATGAIIVVLVVSFVCQVAAGAAAGFVGGLIAALTHSVQGRLLGGIAGAAAGVAIAVPMTAGMVIFVYRMQRGGGASVADQFS